MNALDAIGNPVRRELLEQLQASPRSVSELHSTLAKPISRPAVSKHLRLLSDAGLVTHESVGTRNLYRLRPEGFEPVRAYLERFWDDAIARYKMVAENLEAE